MKPTYEISPSVLARSPRQFFSLQKKLSKLSRVLHIDIMDGRFISTQSISPATLAKAHLTQESEIHLMVQRPSSWLDAVLASGARSVILQAEIAPAERRKAQASFRRSGLTVGIGIKMTTPLKKIPAGTKWIHIMLGPIGSYGSSISPHATKRIRTVRQRFPRAMLSGDVGLQPKTIPAVIQAGLNRVIVGAYLARAGSPAVAWKTLQSQQRGHRV